MTTPNVAYQRPEMEQNIVKWTLIQDCVEGQAAVKAKGDKYLPRPDPSNCTDANLARYENYLQRAVFYNVLSRTLSGMTGLVFQQDPDMRMPEDMEILRANLDGAGVGAFQQMRKAFKTVLAFGRAGLLTDFPPAAVDPITGRFVGHTRQAMMDGTVQPTVSLYMPWQIINWREEYRNGKVVLTQLVIVEKIPGKDDGFQQDYTPAWRHLYLDAQGNCWQKLWINAGKEGATLAGGASYIVSTENQICDSNGVPLKFIPFQFIGSETNNAEVDPPPMYDMAVINVAHYRNSADYEESCFVTGQPTVWASGLTEDWIKDVLKGEIRLGSYGGIPLPVDAEVGLLQTNPNTQPFEAMKQKESQMVAIGARLIRDQGSVERREVEIKNEAASEASLITAVAQNIEAAYRKAVKWCALFYGHGEDEVILDLSYNFIFSQMTYQERQQLVNEWVAGAISFTELRRNLKQAGIAKQPDEEAKSEIDKELVERDAREVSKAKALQPPQPEVTEPEKTSD